MKHPAPPNANQPQYIHTEDPYAEYEQIKRWRLIRLKADAFDKIAAVSLDGDLAGYFQSIQQIIGEFNNG